MILTRGIPSCVRLWNRPTISVFYFDSDFVELKNLSELCNDNHMFSSPVQFKCGEETISQPQAVVIAIFP